MKSHFPILNEYTYLNTPEQGLTSQTLHDYRLELNQRVLNDPFFLTREKESLMDEVRKSVAHFLDAADHLTGLIPNFSFGFNAVLDLIDSSYKTLLIEEDYPSINHNVEARSFHRIYIPLSENIEEHIRHAVIKHRPKVFCFSIVQYVSGIKMDLEFIKKLKLEFPDIIIIADGTQYIGTELFRFRESGIDILAASCYKWMHAGNGNAFICFNEKVIEKLKPKNLTYEPSVFTNARGSFMGHFEPGHLDLLNFRSLNLAVDHINNIKMEVIDQKTKNINRAAFKKFKQLNLLEYKVANRPNHSTIFNLKGSDFIFQKLLENKILCCQRGDGIRVGFTYYNDLNDLNRLIAIFEHYL